MLLSITNAIYIMLQIINIFQRNNITLIGLQKDDAPISFVFNPDLSTICATNQSNMTYCFDYISKQHDILLLYHITT